jgi:ribosomal protein S18 acetylase RimI-like enzyme
MEHILDNPIYNGLNTGNKHLSLGSTTAKYFPSEVAPFAGLKENTPVLFDELQQITDGNATLVLFTPTHLDIPEPWKVVDQMDLLQLVFEQSAPPAPSNNQCVPLGLADVPQMLALTARTKPGPFLSRTIEFGNYTGIFDGDELVAMAGHRLQPLPYVEISAVCTHPDHLRKGYASQLLAEQIRLIQAAGHIAFLHVKADNYSAVQAYLRVGFQVRREMFVYVISQESKLR